MWPVTYGLSLKEQTVHYCLGQYTFSPSWTTEYPIPETISHRKEWYETQTIPKSSDLFLRWQGSAFCQQKPCKNKGNHQQTINHWAVAQESQLASLRLGTAISSPSLAFPGTLEADQELTLQSH